MKALKRIRLFLNGRSLANLVKTLSFLVAFEQILETCLSNFRLLSDAIPRSSTLLLSQAILYQEMTLIAIKFHVIHFKPSNSSELCSKVSITDFKFELQTYGVVSSTKLHISTPFNAKNISLM